MKANGRYVGADHSDEVVAVAPFASAPEDSMTVDPRGYESPEFGGGFGFVDQVRREVAPAVSSLGFDLVELDATRLSRRSQIRLVVYRAGAMTVGDCAEIARAIRYRLALVPGAEDASLEVSSPGTTRKIKAPHEYGIFCGRTVEVLVDDCWIRGVIAAVEDGTVTLNVDCKDRQIEIERIRKGRLSDDIGDGMSSEDVNVQ